MSLPSCVKRLCTLTSCPTTQHLHNEAVVSFLARYMYSLFKLFLLPNDVYRISTMLTVL